VLADKSIWKLNQPEFHRPWLLWDRCFDLAPEASKRVNRGLWEDHLDPGDKGGGVRQSGFRLRSWASAYARTKDEQFLKAIAIELDGRGPGQRGRTDAASTLSFAIDCEGAALHVPEPLATRLRTLAASKDELVCSLPHEL